MSEQQRQKIQSIHELMKNLKSIWTKLIISQIFNHRLFAIVNVIKHSSSFTQEIEKFGNYIRSIKCLYTLKMLIIQLVTLPM